MRFSTLFRVKVKVERYVYLAPVKKFVLDTTVWTVFTSGRCWIFASSLPVISFVTSIGVPTGSDRVIDMKPLSACGTKLKGICGAINTAVKIRNAPAPTRIQTLRLTTLTSTRAYASLTQSIKRSVRLWSVVVSAWKKLRNIRPR